MSKKLIGNSEKYITTHASDFITEIEKLYYIVIDEFNIGIKVNNGLLSDNCFVKFIVPNIYIKIGDTIKLLELLK